VFSAGILAPTFASGTLSYDLAVPNGTTSITLTPTATSAAVQSDHDRQDAGGAMLATNGSPSSPLAMPEWVCRPAIESS